MSLAQFSNEQERYVNETAGDAYRLACLGLGRPVAKSRQEAEAIANEVLNRK